MFPLHLGSSGGMYSSCDGFKYVRPKATLCHQAPPLLWPLSGGSLGVVAVREKPPEGKAEQLQVS